MAWDGGQTNGHVDSGANGLDAGMTNGDGGDSHACRMYVSVSAVHIAIADAPLVARALSTSLVSALMLLLAAMTATIVANLGKYQA